jgi:lysophospholipase L1-like esterase
MTSKRSKILLLGDSLTQLAWQGWAGDLANVYQRRADVMNRGMSGYNTRWYLEYAQRSDVWLFNKEEVVLVVLFFGANDASHDVQNARQHVPLKEFANNLSQLIDQTRRSYPQAEIVILTAPPVQHEQRLAFQKERYGNQATGILERSLELSQQYAQAAIEVALQQQISAVVDLWSLIQQQPNWDECFTDGLHFSDRGNQAVGDALVKAIFTHYSHLKVNPCPITSLWANSASTSLLPLDGPHHDDLTPQDYPKVFEKHYDDGKKN